MLSRHVIPVRSGPCWALKGTLLRHRVIKVVYLVLLVAPVLVAFLVADDLDDVAVLGNTGDVWITETDGSADAVAVGRVVSAFARDHDASVVREESDFHDPDRVTHLYVATDDRGSAPGTWLERGYSTFGSGMRFHTHPFQQITEPDPRGVYHVFGSDDAMEALQVKFAEVGLTGEVVPPFDFGERFQYQAVGGPSGMPPLGLVVGIVALGVVLSVGASVLVGAKEYAVLRLHGMSFLQMLWRDLKQLAKFWLIAAAGVAAVTLIVVGLYNGFGRLGLFAAVAGTLAAVLSLLAVVAHIAGLVLATRSRTLRGLKGGIAAGPALTSTYLVRVCAALVVLLSGGATVESWQQAAQQEASQQRVALLGQDATYVAIRGSRTPETSELVSDQVGQWLRNADRRGQVIATYQWSMAQIAPEVGLPGSFVLRVNETFLTRQQILDPSGKRYHPDPGSEAVRVIIPEKFGDHADAIAELVPGIVNPEDEGARVHDAGVKQEWAHDDQTVATFQSNESMAPLGRLVLDDPLLIVVPNGSHVTSNHNYTAMATRDGIIFPDRQDALDAIGQQVPREDIGDLAPVTRRVAIESAQATQELRLNVLTLSSALLVLFVTGLGVCVIYGRKNAQTIFVKHISGWPLLSIHRNLFMLDLLVAAALVAWVGWNIWRRITALEQFSDLGVPPPPTLPGADWWELAAAAGVAVLATTILIAGVVLIHRRIVKEHAADV